MKKKLCFVLAAILVFASLCTGCGKGDQETGADNNTLKYWVAFTGAAVSKVSDMNGLEMYKQREKDSGIHIEFIHPPAGQEKEQFNLMIAARDLPDVIEHSWSSAYAGGPAKAIEDDIIVSLNPYMDTCMPNFKKILEEGELASVYKKGSLTDAGDYYGFPELCVEDIRIFAGLYLRKDWLDELNLSVPETIDEWTTVLRAFKEKKGAKSPLTGTATTMTNDTVSHHFNGAYGVGRRLYLEGDTVKFAPLEPGFKDYLQLMHSWYAEGLLDNDYPTNTNDIILSKMVTNVSGASYGFVGSGIGTLMGMEKSDANFNLVAAAPPTLNKGETSRFANNYNDVRDRALCITTACKKPEVAAKWADFWYSEEGMRLLNFGVEGDSYNMVDGHAVYTDQILNNPDGLDANTAMALTFRGLSSAPGLMQHPDYLEGRYQMPQQKEAFALWQKNSDLARKTTLPLLVPTGEESNELATFVNDLTTYYQEMMLKFIQGTESFDHYDNFVNTMKTKFQAERYLEIQQAMYNRYLAR